MAALLLLGGAAAVAVGVAGQEAPVAPPSVRTAAAGPAGSTPPPVGPAAVTGPAGPAAVTGPAGPGPGTAAAPAAAPVALPVSLHIPAIGVRSDLLTLGLAPDGSLEVPQPGPDYDRAAWFDGSPRPGQVGPAVIEGHVDSATGGPSVFFDLGALQPGDDVEVLRADGSAVRFVVDAVRSYPKDAFPTLEVYGNTAGPELRLITCGGAFDRGSGHYRDNVVVFASMAPAPR